MKVGSGGGDGGEGIGGRVGFDLLGVRGRV